MICVHLCTMIGSGRGGGGGGFGSFPYRSSHQQGTDGPNRGKRGNNKQKSSNNRCSSSQFQSQLDVPVDQRRILVGKNAATLQWLKDVSGANVFVPRQNNNCRVRREDADDSDGAGDISQQQQQHEQQQQHPVRVNTSDLPSLLHAFHEIASLLSKSNDFDQNSISCTVKMRSDNSDTKINGELFVPSDNASESSHGYCLFRGTMGQLQSQFQVYTTETRYDVDNISTIVDNTKFVQSSLADCPWFCKDAPVRNSSLAESSDNQPSRRLVFVYGSDDTNPRLLYDAISQAMLTAEHDLTSSKSHK